MEKLKQTLKVIKSNELHKEFHRIANDLFSNYVIKSIDRSFYFIELEFYYHSKNHKDVFIYKKEPQMTTGHFFKHGSGLDLTFGDKANNIFGGILIRGLYDFKNDKYENGPWNVLKALTNNNTKLNDDQINSVIEIVQHTHDCGLIFYSSRINLSKSIPDPVKMRDKHYRFITSVCPENKFREKTRVAEIALKNKLLSSGELKQHFGYQIVK